MPRTAAQLAFACAVICLTVLPAMAREMTPAQPNHLTPATASIYAHGTLRQADRALEAVVEVGADFLSNVQTGQQVWMDVRQGQLHGIVKSVHSAVEVTIALDGAGSQVRLSRLQPGQAVIAIIQLDPECGPGPLEL